MAESEASGATIWWSQMCNNYSEQFAFWSDQVTVNTADPDFTLCFQVTILTWAPCFILWFGAPFYFAHLYDKPYKHSKGQYSCLNLCKTILIIILIDIEVAQFAYTVLEHSSYPLAWWLQPWAYIVTFILALALTRYEFCKGSHSSGLMFCFWLLLVVLNVVPFRTKLTRTLEEGTNDIFLLVLFFVFYCVTVATFALHLFSDVEAKYPKGGYQPFANKKIKITDEDDEKTPLLGNQKDVGEPLANGLKTSVNAETKTPEENPCPELIAPFWSRISFLWCSRILAVGYKKQLTGDKLWDLRPQDVTRVLVDIFYRKWIKTGKDKSASKAALTKQNYYQNGSILKSNQKYERLSSELELPKTKTWKLQSSIVMATIRAFGWYFSLIAIFEVFTIALTFIRPTLLDYLITFVESGDPYVWRGYLYAISLFVLTIIRGIIQQQHFFGKFVTGMRIKSAVNAAVYRKALLLANSCRSKYSVGEIVNLMAVDSQRISDATFYLHNLWSAPVNIIVAMVMLWGYLGPASLAGLALLIGLVAMNLFLASKVKQLQVKTMRLKDKRTKQTNEILNGVKVLKLYAWEGAFQDRLLDVRNEELSYIKKAAFYLSGTSISFNCAPVLYTVVSFTIYTLTTGSGGLSAQIAFVSLTLVNSLTTPLTFLPNGIANLVQALVSVKRLDTYFNDDELDPDAVQSNPSENAVEIRNGTFSWDTGETTVLNDVSFEIKPGSFTAIVGQVGAGKSSLLSAILGELYKVDGRVNTQGKIAYVPQEAWIRNQVLKKNVLFGKPLKQNVYDSVLEACALMPDLKILPAGDMTEIGEKGINLSGGQKARVSLARAVYSNADIYLLDDPLSAVDSHVGKHIFTHVLGPEGMLKNKTRILVTHSLTYLPKADQIICLKDGKVTEIGTYSELLSHNGAFAELIRTYLNEDDINQDDDEDPEEAELMSELRRQISVLSETEVTKSGTDSDSSRKLVRRKSRRSSSEKNRPPKQDDLKIPPKHSDDREKGKKLIGMETSEVGNVNIKVIIMYMKSFGFICTICIIASFIGQVGFDLFSNIWLSLWGGDMSAVGPNATVDTDLANLRVGVYGAIGGAQAISIFVQTISVAIASLTAAGILHERLLDAIIKAPMSFFDTTPVGRILNRFSSDMATVDSNIRFTIIAIFRGCSQLLTTLIAISYATPIFLIAIIPLSITYYFIQRFYVVTANQLRRLNSVRNSPIYSHFGESITGASSIRAYRLTEEFTQESDRLIDRMQMARFPSLGTNRWLSIWLEVLGAFIVLFCGLFAVIARDTITGGLVGLSVSYALQVTNRLAMFVRNTADLETNYVSVERIHEYSQTKSEAPWNIPETKPDRYWPPEGQVSVDNYSTRYRPGLELVLNKISFSASPGEKVGIVGRTGAGKSSMTLGLFRIIEAAEGTITIDNVNTATIGLHDLRSKLTIIPQDPVLFSGTIRFNIDPFDRHTDAELWDTLKHAHLKDFVASLPAQLQHECTEGGGNLSVGQRQLVCLARALLRRTKILILDEATAAVDLETDDLIQTTIRSEFKDCSVLTIAHRINTVLDYDRVMVLDHGKIKEFDNPSTLLNDPDSSFYAMCRDAGLVGNNDNGASKTSRSPCNGDNSNGSSNGKGKSNGNHKNKSGEQ